MTEPQPVAWQVQLKGNGAWDNIPAKRVDEFKQDGHAIRALYPQMTVETLAAERDAALLRLRVYEEEDSRCKALQDELDRTKTELEMLKHYLETRQT